MADIRLTVNGQEILVPSGATILEAARRVEIYIPTLCSHPDLPPAVEGLTANSVFQDDRMIKNTMPDEPGKGCGLCVVEIEGRSELVESCSTEVNEGMVVITESDQIRARRQEKLLPILIRHRHACLTCAQQEGCSRSQCSANVPENERCCPQFGHCELQDVANYVGISDATPKWIPTDLPVFKDDPLYVRDYSLCIGCTRCVRACKDLRGVEALGFVYDRDGQIHVGSIGPSLEESGCKFCTACVEVCPTGALTDKNLRPGKKEEDLVPCRETCPARVDVPEYLRLIAAGKPDEANAVIREKVPFPGILGRVCDRPCEDVCRRGEVNEPVAICSLKRYAADREKGLWKENIQTDDQTGKKVAVVGSGPAGLTVAFFLRKKGHDVTIFESRDQAGGMMRFGIPFYRLPQDVLDKEITDILDMGITFRPGQCLGKDFTLDQLRDDSFDAVFLGVGAQLSRRISIDGSELKDVLWGVDFLGSIARGEDLQLKERVVVIGGGNVAVDVALSALRCGAKEVTMVCLESREEMPAHEREIQGTIDEGVRLMPSRGPHRVLGTEDRVTGVELIRCTAVFDEQGNFSPVYDENTKEEIKADQVIMAIGQASDFSFVSEESRISVDRGLIVVDRDSLETGMKGVYAGGDAVAMPGAIIHAVEAGRKAAEAIDRALGGTGEIDDVLFQRGEPEQNIGRNEDFALWPREKVPKLQPESRIDGFDEISLGYDDDQARKEAARCLQCDLRLHMACNPSPPAKWLVFNEENVSQTPEEEGVYQLLDEEHNVLAIKGTANLRESLLEELEEGGPASQFELEEDKMYSKRESELIQQYLQEHGEMPDKWDSDLNDLF